MRRVCAVLLAALVGVGFYAAPASSHYDDDDYDHHGYYDDHYDHGYYDDHYDHGYYDDYDHGHHRGYYDGPRCVFRHQVGAIVVDFLCHY